MRGEGKKGTSLAPWGEKIKKDLCGEALKSADTQGVHIQATGLIPVVSRPSKLVPRPFCLTQVLYNPSITRR